MKFASFVLACFFMLAIATSSSASELLPTDSLTFAVAVKPVEEKAIELNILNLQKKRTQINIQDLEGSTTYFTDFAKNRNSYRKKINLKELADGKYLLVITQGEQKQQQVIVLKEGRGMLLSDIK